MNRLGTNKVVSAVRLADSLNRLAHDIRTGNVDDYSSIKLRATIDRFLAGTQWRYTRYWTTAGILQLTAETIMIDTANGNPISAMGRLVADAVDDYRGEEVSQ